MTIVPVTKQKIHYPGWLNKMVENNWLGDKTGQGFLKKKERQVKKKSSH
jgi:3-hydroxyacyl-CoA dehydrogenase